MIVDLNTLTKLYYSIGEVSDMFKVAPSMIRYWETEFIQMKPGKNTKGERRYTIKDIELIQRIYHLTKEKGYTIEGAKKALEELLQAKKEDTQLLKHLKSLRKKLLDLKSAL